MNLLADEIFTWVSQWMLPFVRVGSFMMMAPVFGSDFVPIRVRLILALAISLFVAPLLPPVPEMDALSASMIVVLLQQVLIGILMGFFLQMVFQVFVLLGQMIAMQMGLGFASMMDPANGVNVPILSTFYLMFVTLLFLTLDGHLIMIDVLAQSFSRYPISGPWFDGGLIMEVISTMSWLFASAMGMALPAVTALLMSNLAFGIMTRAAPQMNIFALGFPVALMFGLFLIWLMFTLTAEFAEGLFLEAFMRMRELFN